MLPAKVMIHIPLAAHFHTNKSRKAHPKKAIPPGPFPLESHRERRRDFGRSWGPTNQFHRCSRPDTIYSIYQFGPASYFKQKDKDPLNYA